LVSNASIQPECILLLGFDAIAVALLGNTSAIGSFFASLLVMILIAVPLHVIAQAGASGNSALITSICALQCHRHFFRNLPIASNRKPRRFEAMNTISLKGFLLTASLLIATAASTAKARYQNLPWKGCWASEPFSEVSVCNSDRTFGVIPP
jgi:type IV secretory pathway VirB3-like protein